MAVTFIATQQVTRDGLNPTFENANADGHRFVITPTTWLEVINAGGSPCTVLIGQKTDEWTKKTNPADTFISVTVPAGERRKISCRNGTRFGTVGPDLAGFGFLATPTSVTVAVFDMAPLP